MNARVAGVVGSLLAAVAAFAQQAGPDAEAGADAKRLDKLQAVFSSTPQFGEVFLRASKRVADERGTGIIRAVMARSVNWKDEEGLVFVPLLELLPREAALKILREYQRSKVEAERVWAGEFITEFGMADTKINDVRKSGAAASTPGH